jgi:citrate lyase subunit beta/citryl-CoA lyase
MRSWLFVPGDSEGKIAKARGLGADVLILDLEDSVALSRKGEARAIVARTLMEKRDGLKIYVRINPLSSGMALEDLACVMTAMPDGIVLPKTDSGADVTLVSHWIDAFEAVSGTVTDRTKILPIATETGKSVFSLGTYADRRLVGLTWGAEDLPAAVGAATGREADGTLTDLCRLARSLCLAGAAAAGVPAIETVYPNFRDLDGLRDYAARGRRDGFVGMLAIHPGQVAIINEMMTPSEAEVNFAQSVMAAFAAAPGAGVVSMGGKMLDMPHLKQAERILAQMDTLSKKIQS